METINNITAAATKVIWGESNTNGNETAGTEPLSGETGDVKAGEPYDKGNLDTATSTSENPVSTSSEIASTTLPIRSEHETDKTIGTDTTAATASDPITSSNDTSVNPSSSFEPTSSESQKIEKTKQDAEETAKVDTSRLGLKPLEEKAGNIGGADSTTGTVGDAGLQKDSIGEGTGEKYVQTTGLKTGGGDLDASKPSTAKEADSLLAEKSIHRDAPAEVATSKSDESPHGSLEKKEKKSLKEKIKAKLHRDKD